VPCFRLSSKGIVSASSVDKSDLSIVNLCHRNNSREKEKQMQKTYKNPQAGIISVLVLITVLLVTASPTLAEQKLSKISNNVYAYVGSTDDSASNSFGANAGVIIGEDAVLVIDTLISDQKAKAFIKDIRALTDKPISFVVNTHFHSDHSYGNCTFAEQGATIISQSDTKSIMEKWAKKVLENAEAWMGLTKEEMAGTSIVYPQLTFNDQMEIDLGGLRVELNYVAYSHTRGSVFAFIPAQKVLFTGDILFTDYYPNMGASDVDGWVQTIDHLLSLDVEQIVPGHGPLSSKQDLADQRKFLLVFDEKAKELSSGSSDIGQVAEQIKGLIPEKPYGVRMITSSLKRKYMSKK
jgi:cyclase